MGIEYTGGIRSVRIGVDVEVSLHLTPYDVYILPERTWGTLLTVGSTSDDVDGEVGEDIM